MSAVLVTKGISQPYGNEKVKVRARRSCSMAIEKGEFVAIVGKSGSGKSTLLRCATMLETMDSGELIYLGERAAWNNEQEETVYAPKQELRKIRQNYGLVFQNYNLFPHFSVLKNITDAPVAVQKRDKKEAVKTAMELLKKMGLEDKADAYPCQLSGGQCQRVAIARALVNDPDILLADEPTGNLDSKTSQDVLGLLKVTSKRFHQTIVMITHNEEIAQMADRILQIEDGKIVSDSGLV